MASTDPRMDANIIYSMNLKRYDLLGMSMYVGVHPAPKNLSWYRIGGLQIHDDLVEWLRPRYR